MKYDTKNIIKSGVIGLLYIALGVLGIYSDTLFILFPILAVPMTVWIMSNKINLRRDVFVNITIVLFIYIITGRVQDTLLYIVNVAVPAYIMGIMYKKKLKIPHILMYTAIGTIGALFIYVIGMSYLGVDYISGYLKVLEYSKQLQFEAIDSMMKSSTPDVAEQLRVFKEMVGAYVILMHYVYPAMCMVIGVLLTVVQLILVTVVGRLKKWYMPTLKELAQFKLSKVALVVLMVAMIVSKSTEDISGVSVMLALNVSLFIQNLFQLVGIITMIVMVRRSKLVGVLKALGVIISIVLFYILPPVAMLIGCLDSIFNYKKVEITV